MATTIIKSADSDNQAIVTSEGRLLVSGDVNTSGNVSNPSIGPNNQAAPTSATEIAGIAPNGNLVPVSVTSSGAVNVNGNFTGTVNADTVESGTVDYTFGNVTAVPAGTLVTIATYIAGGPTRMKFVEVSGTNIAQYSVLINGTMINRKQTYYGYLDTNFQFSKGLSLNANDTVTVTVSHNNTNSPGDFSAFILFLKDY